MKDEIQFDLSVKGCAPMTTPAPLLDPFFFFFLYFDCQDSWLQLGGEGDAMVTTLRERRRLPTFEVLPVTKQTYIVIQILPTTVAAICGNIALSLTFSVTHSFPPFNLYIMFVISPMQRSHHGKITNSRHLDKTLALRQLVGSQNKP